MAYYEDIIIDDDGKTMCNLCEICILDDEAIESHLNCKNHNDLYIQRLMIQNNVIVRENKGHCLICKENLKDLLGHIQSFQHQGLMLQINAILEKDGGFLELPCNIRESRLNVYCTICDGYIDFSLNKLEEHIHTSKHRRARAMAVQPYNGIFSVEGSNDDLWCKICQVYFENYIEIILEHVDEDKEHNTRLTKILGLIEGQNITIDKYLTNVTEDKAMCHKCNTEVSCNADNLERHIKGKRHENDKV